MNVLRSNWFTGLLIITMPFALFYWMSTAMAYGQVQREAELYDAMGDYTSIAALQSAPIGELIFLQGQLQPADDAAAQHADGGLLIYQERPLDGREVRFGEEFPLTLPAFVLALEDGEIAVIPNTESERLISHERHRLVVGDRELTGFQVGDTVTVQGKWQPTGAEVNRPLLADATGVFGADKAQLISEVQSALQTVRWVRDGLGLLTLISIVLLAIQVYRWRKIHPLGTSAEALDALPYSA